MLSITLFIFSIISYYLANNILSQLVNFSQYFLRVYKILNDTLHNAMILFVLQVLSMHYKHNWFIWCSFCRSIFLFTIKLIISNYTITILNERYHSCSLLLVSQLHPLLTFIVDKWERDLRKFTRISTPWLY